MGSSWGYSQSWLHLGRHRALTLPVGGLSGWGAGSTGVLESPRGTSRLLGQDLVAHTQESGKWALGRGYARQADSSLYKSRLCGGFGL